ncbi:MAG: bifunctional adenosylcobinamide kinase/adenosylcobinamide-phosphate guanylyltransferase [Clostridia bacterium]|nr:bifunctional adenosylcobinamide kinase/adenosylcobinamide-phosphate guanylyltransferase [Clostridia bacterium]
MVLIIGSQASGKREYAMSLGYAECDMADAVLDERPVLYNLQDMVARAPECAPALLEALLEKQAVICNEVGSGIIPVNARDRSSREQTGRLCVLLAQRAERVVRLVCGIPMVIK